MESNTARRLPGIKQLARRFNAMRDTLAQEAARKRLNVTIPLAVNVEQLFNTDANLSMWMEDGQIGESSPAYLTNPAVQQGIGSILVQDRGEEESHRLKHELEALVQWVTSNLQNVEHAITRCKGEGSF